MGGALLHRHMGPRDRTVAGVAVPGDAHLLRPMGPRGDTEGTAAWGKRICTVTWGLATRLKREYQHGGSACAPFMGQSDGTEAGEAVRGKRMCTVTWGHVTMLKR